MSSGTILGVDPGLTGAIALYNPDARTTAVFAMPTLRLARGGKQKGEIDVVELARLIDAHGPIARAVVERVGAMPGQGVSSVFAFGKGYGIILGILAANFVPTDLVAPATWKRAMGIATGSGKDASRARASALLPHMAGHWPRVMDDGKAEACLIALYATGAR